jgi:hypothetical protein
MNKKHTISTENLKGKIFGRLEILEIQNLLCGNQVRKKAFCQCSCGNTKWITFENIRKGDSASCGCLGKENALKAVTKYEYNTKFFKSFSDEMYYILGLIYTDGSLSGRRNTFSISLHGDDKKLLEEIGLILRKSITLYKSSQANNYTLFCTNKEMYNDLINLGLYVNKSTTLKVIDILKNNRHFWRGVIDGDGSLFVSKTYLYLSLCGTKDVCESFKEWVLSLGSNSKSTSRSKPGYSFDFREIQFSGKTAVLVANELYKDNPTLKLERKFNNFINYEKKIERKNRSKI